MIEKIVNAMAVILLIFMAILLSSLVVLAVVFIIQGR